MENDIKVESNNSINKETSNINNNNIIMENNPNNKQAIIKDKDENIQEKILNLENDNNENEEEPVIPKRGVKRYNSLNLYKKQQKKKHKNDSINNNNEVKEENNNNAPIENNEVEKINKLIKKKVVFLPNFLTIIDVESFKKFNFENTCKDPFDNMLLLNDNISLNYKNGDDDELDGKTNLLCSCSIF